MNPRDRLRAPVRDGAVFAIPPLHDVDALPRLNRARFCQAHGDILGRPLGDLRREACAATVSAAADYLRAAGEPVPPFRNDSLIISGHQPELFHPGVWLKNFAIQQLAHAHQLTSLHLIVDNDTAKTNVLRLPAKDADTAPARLEGLPFDRWPGEIPYEERVVVDESLFASCAERATRALRAWNYEPFLPAFWAEVARHVSRTRLLGERFSAARRTIERQWGCHNLEVPVSQLCRTEPFAWFACHLLVNLPRFHAIYNQSVRAFRRLHGIRSRNHPVPDLAKQGDWWEMPFWAWRQGQARRGRPLARLTDTAIELRVGAETWLKAPVTESGSALVDSWRTMEARGLKIRNRALTTTLYARLFLADLFVHGIGGAKYDELTDALIRDFHGIEPPGFMVLSGTLLLPIEATVTQRDSRQLARLLRDLKYNPQRHVETSENSADFGAARRAKQDWIARATATAAERRERFEQLRGLNEQLFPFVAEQDRRVRQELDVALLSEQTSAVLKRRDYAFCLYPERQLRDFFEGSGRFGTS